MDREVWLSHWSRDEANFYGAGGGGLRLSNISREKKSEKDCRL